MGAGHRSSMLRGRPRRPAPRASSLTSAAAHGTDPHDHQVALPCAGSPAHPAQAEGPLRHRHGLPDTRDSAAPGRARKGHAAHHARPAPADRGRDRLPFSSTASRRALAGLARPRRGHGPGFDPPGGGGPLRARLDHPVRARLDHPDLQPRLRLVGPGLRGRDRPDGRHARPHASHHAAVVATQGESCRLESKRHAGILARTDIRALEPAGRGRSRRAGGSPHHRGSPTDGTGSPRHPSPNWVRVQPTSTPLCGPKFSCSRPWGGGTTSVMVAGPARARLPCQPTRSRTGTRWASGECDAATWSRKMRQSPRHRRSAALGRRPRPWRGGSR